MQDGVRIHTAHIIKNWCEEKGIEVVDWPLYSPDLNPIEHVWVRLKEILWERHSELLQEKGNSQALKDRLFNAIQEAWDVVEDEYLDALLESMPRRVKAVCKACEWYTKY